MILINKEPLRIKKIEDEGKNIKTFFFENSIDAEPGKFLQLYIPEYGEKPFSISSDDPLGITARRIEKNLSNPNAGKFTNKLFELGKGDVVEISGPYGTGFPLEGFNYRKVCIVGGGTGIAPLAFLSEKIHDSKIIAFLGAKTVDEMIMEKRFKCRVNCTTDDGSYRKKGFITDSLEEYDLESIAGPGTKAAICGPEKMMYKAAETLERYMPTENIYLSVERLMKCGVGLCGSCEFGGNRVCVDGPVFNYKEIKDVPDFGKFKRDRCGRKELL